LLNTKEIQFALRRIAASQRQQADRETRIEFKFLERAKDYLLKPL